MAIREDKFRKILDAAVEAFAESGFYQCQVAKIARLAGVADGTIYLYFKSKEEILIRLFQERMGQFNADVRSRIDRSTDTYAKLKAIVEAHFSYMGQNRSMAVVTQLELRQPDTRIRTAIREPVLEYFRLIEGVVQAGIENKEVAEVNVRAARQMIFGALDEAVTDWVLAKNPRPLMGQAETLLELFAGALRLRKAS